MEQEFTFTDEPTDQEFVFTDEPSDLEFTDEPTTDWAWTNVPSVRRAAGAAKEGTKDVVRNTAKGILGTVEAANTPTRAARQAAEVYAQNAGSDGLSPVARGQFADMVTEYYEATGQHPDGKMMQELKRALKENRHDEIMAKVKDADGWVNSKLAADPEYFQSEGFLEDVIRMGPQIGGQILTSVMAGPAAGAVFMGTQIMGSTMEQLKAKGVDPVRAFNAGLANAVMQAPMEQIGIGKMTKLWKTKGAAITKLKEMGQAMGTEWLTEFLQSQPELATSIWGEGKGKEAGTLLKEFLAAEPEALKQGAYEGTVAMVFPGAAGSVQVGRGIQQDRTLKKHLGEDKYNELKNNPTVTQEDLDREYKKAKGLPIQDRPIQEVEGAQPQVSEDLDKAFEQEEETPAQAQPEAQEATITKTDDHLSTNKPADVLSASKGLPITPAEATSTGMTLEEHQQVQREKVEAGETVNRVRIAQVERQEQMRRNQEQIKRQEYEAKVQAQRNDALQQEKIAAAENQRFLDDLATPQGLMNRMSATANQMQESEFPADKKIGQALRKLHKAMALGKHAPDQLADLQYEVDEAVKLANTQTSSFFQKAHALKGAMDTLLPKLAQAHVLAEQKAQPKVEPAQVSREIGSNTRAKTEQQAAAAESKRNAEQKAQGKKVPQDHSPKDPTNLEVAKKKAQENKRSLDESLRKMRRRNAGTDAAAAVDLAEAETRPKPSNTKRPTVKHPNRQLTQFPWAKVEGMKDIDPANHGQVERVKSILQNQLEQNTTLTVAKRANEALKINNWAKDMHQIAKSPVRLARFRRTGIPEKQLKSMSKESKLTPEEKRNLSIAQDKPSNQGSMKPPKAIDEDGTVHYRKGEEGTQELEGWASLVNDELKKSTGKLRGSGRIVVVNTTKDLPSDLAAEVRRDNAENDAMGMFYDGKIYVVAGNNPDIIEAKRTVWHELGHFSFVDLFGKDGKALLNQISLKYRQEIHQRLNDLGVKRANRTQAMFEREAEEILIDQFVQNKKSSFVDKLKQLLRDLAKRLGFNVSDELTDADMAKMVAKMRKHLMKPRPASEVQKAHKAQLQDVVHYRLDDLKWQHPNDKEIFGTVNNRLSKEVEVVERLFGELPSAIQAPGKLVGGKRLPTRTIHAHDLGKEFFRLKKNGTLKRYLDPKVPAETLADERGVKGTERKKFLSELKAFRDGSLYNPDRQPILSQNGKAGRSVDFSLGSCQPTMPCKECYAAASMIRMSAVRKAVRNFAAVIENPKLFGQEVAKEAKKVPQVKMPFLRLLGSGDLTTTEQVTAFNELANPDIS